MIVGHGDIAQVLKQIDHEDVIYFASGVSNSKETRQSEYDREANLLMKQDKDKHLVYFSSLCVFYADTLYARHKKEMENLVSVLFPHYTIVRIGNITWGTNPFTLINALKSKFRNGEPIELKNEYRYIVDEDEFIYWLKMIPSWNCEMNITGRRLTVRQVFDTYVIENRGTYRQLR